MFRSSIYLIFLTSLFVSSSSAQVAIKNSKSTNANSNVLYIGVENALEVSGAKSTELRLESLTSDVHRNGSNSFILNPKYKGVDTIRIYDGEQLLLSQPFQVNRIPDPVISIGNILGNEITLADIIAKPVLEVVLPGYLYKHQFTVTKFSGSFIPLNGEAISFASNKNRFSKEPLATIKGLTRGDKIVFDSIEITCPGCTKSNMQLTVTIK